MNELYTQIEKNGKVAIEVAELSATAFSEILNNQVSLLNELVNGSLAQVKSLQGVDDVSTAVENSKTFSADIEAKARKVLGANVKVIEETSKKTYDLFSKQVGAAAQTSSK